nr:ankyrin repeat domain-containing protein [Oceanusvirus sp.]
MTMTTKQTLCAAVRRGCDVATVLDMLKAGADPNEEDGYHTPLSSAVIKMNLALVTVLLRAGADPNARSALGVTPLMHATYDRATDIVRILHQYGADLDAVCENTEYTALATAARSNDIVMFSLLVELGADTSLRVRGWTPHQLAVVGRLCA